MVELKTYLEMSQFNDFTLSPKMLITRKKLLLSVINEFRSQLLPAMMQLIVFLRYLIAAALSILSISIKHKSSANTTMAASVSMLERRKEEEENGATLIRTAFELSYCRFISKDADQ